MKTIPLTNSDTVAVVSDIDYAWASQHKWYLKKSQFCSYVARNVRVGNKVKTLRMHREIAQKILGNFPLPSNKDVHHVNHDTADNTRENLELIHHVTHGRLCHAGG